MKCCTFLICVYLLATNLLAAETPGIVAKEPANGRSVKIKDGYMVPYTVKLTDAVSFEMIPIPGGRFKLGSPDSEKGRNKDEDPQVEVEIEPFWMGKCEVTWGEYEEWLRYKHVFNEDTNYFQEKARKNAEQFRVDAVTAPSEIYDSTYVKQYGKDPNLPAVTMSQFAARQYTKWLSKLTNQIYRLPNEAEWEYACRAGTSTAYSSGDDPKLLGDYAWTAENAQEKPHLVGLKKPNVWGLHDMHGNVMEWTLDAYTKEGYQRLAAKPPVGLAITNWPQKLFPRVVRGGSFEFDAAIARSAARLPSDDDEWNSGDPDSPKTPWWLSNDPVLSVGFRIIRPLQIPDAELLHKLWEVDNETTRLGLKEQLAKGRGSLGVVEPDKDVKIENKVLKQN